MPPPRSIGAGQGLSRVVPQSPAPATAPSPTSFKPVTSRLPLPAVKFCFKMVRTALSVCSGAAREVCSVSDSVRKSPSRACSFGSVSDG